MIVVLCENYQDAADAFDIFVQYLNEVEPWIITRVDVYSLTIDTEYDLRYIFTDYHYAKVFQDLTPDIIDVVEFFEGIEYI